tara:strand:+ start:36 stop:245 length:210 start_codon:yes stop_codon:yes gene_type:complete
MTELQNKSISLIKRQTNYSEETILEKLKKHKNDVEKIILEYNGFDDSITCENITTNQKVFKAIRDNMNK